MRNWREGAGKAWREARAEVPRDSPVRFFLAFVAKAVRGPPKLSHELQAALDGAPAARPKPQPDMTIRDLFLHIDPGVLEAAPSRRERVRDEVIKALSLARIKCWGRLVVAVGWTDGAGVTSSPLTEILPTRWSMGRLTMSFLEKGADQLIHFEGGHPRGAPNHWADLRVNRAQVEAVWPPSDLADPGEVH